jgi:hypothetical protein
VPAINMSSGSPPVSPYSAKINGREQDVKSYVSEMLEEMVRWVAPLKSEITCRRFVLSLTRFPTAAAATPGIRL